jgi:hypothetical protein
MNNMKKKISILIQVIFLALLTGLMSCEEQQIVYEGNSFVQFTDSTLSFKEYYPKAIKIKVHNGATPLDESISVNYTVGGTAREGKDYRIEGTKGTMVIPAKQNFGEITVVLLNNANNILESSNIIFTLTDAKPADKVKVGFGSGGMGKKMTFIIKDACILEGVYNGQLPVRNQVYQVDNIDIVSTDCKRYTINNLNVGLVGFDQFFGWDSPVGFEAERPKLSFIDNGNNTLTIPKQVIDEFAAGYDTLSGTGTWNPQTKRIALNIKWKVYLIAKRKDTLVNVPLNYIRQ